MTKRLMRLGVAVPQLESDPAGPHGLARSAKRQQGVRVVDVDRGKRGVGQPARPPGGRAAHACATCRRAAGTHPAGL